MDDKLTQVVDFEEGVNLERAFYEHQLYFDLLNFIKRKNLTEYIQEYTEKYVDSGIRQEELMMEAIRLVPDDAEVLDFKYEERVHKLFYRKK